MYVSLDAATPTDTLVLDRLLQLYEYDFSEYGGVDVDSSGVFPTVDTQTIWGPDDHTFFIRVGGSLAGFALVTGHESYLGNGDTHLLSEFFVMRKYRRRGVGEHAARALFDRFPGRWELGTARGNVAAQAFWRSVLGRYTDDAYREAPDGCDRWEGPIWAFASKADEARHGAPPSAPQADPDQPDSGL